MPAASPGRRLGAGTTPPAGGSSMNLDHRLDKLEGMLDAASAEVERQRTGSLWDLISRGDYERACGGGTFLAVSLGRSARAIGPKLQRRRDAGGGHRLCAILCSAPTRHVVARDRRGASRPCRQRSSERGARPPSRGPLETGPSWANFWRPQLIELMVLVTKHMILLLYMRSGSVLGSVREPRAARTGAGNPAEAIAPAIALEASV